MAVFVLWQICAMQQNGLTYRWLFGPKYFKGTQLVKLWLSQTHFQARVEKVLKINRFAIFIKLFSNLKTTRKLKTNCHFNSPETSPTFYFISLMIFIFKLTPIILIKYLCLWFDKLVLYWTFCQLLPHWLAKPSGKIGSMNSQFDEPLYFAFLIFKSSAFSLHHFRDQEMLTEGKG